MKKKVIALLGSPYTGSTIISNILNTHPRITTLGEISRYRSFQFYESQPEHYLDACSICSTTEPDISKHSCIWNTDLHQYSLDHNLIDTYNYLINSCKTDIVIDCSKEIDWFLSLLNFEEQFEFQLIFVVLCKSPVRFVDSNRKRIPNKSIFWHVEGWRNIYFYILRKLAVNSQFFLIFRYEDFLRDPQKTLKKLLTRLGLNGEEIELSNTHISDLHILGGNEITFSNHRSFELDNHDPTGQISQYDQDKVAEIIKTGKAKDIIRKIENIKLTKEERDLILMVQGVIDICTQLGYNMSDLRADPIVSNYA